MRWMRMNRWSKTSSPLPLLFLRAKIPLTSHSRTAKCRLRRLLAHIQPPPQIHAATPHYSRPPIHSISKPRRTRNRPHPPSSHNQADLRNTPLSSSSRRTHTSIPCPRRQYTTGSRHPMSQAITHTSAHIGRIIIISTTPTREPPYIMYAQSTKTDTPMSPTWPSAPAASYTTPRIITIPRPSAMLFIIGHSHRILFLCVPLCLSSPEHNCYNPTQFCTIYHIRCNVCLITSFTFLLFFGSDLETLLSSQIKIFAMSIRLCEEDNVMIIIGLSLLRDV